MRKIFLSYFLLLPIAIKAQSTDFNHINLKKADSIAMSYKDASLENLPKLSYQLTSNLKTDIEKFRAIYKWVCTNIENDYYMYSKNRWRRIKYKDQPKELKKWNQAFNKELFKKLRKEKKTVCTGYAYLIKELSTLAGIECVIVDGYGKTSSFDVEKMKRPNHSWNAVRLSGKWYLCDPTWSSGVTNEDTNVFTFKFKEEYFLPDPKLFVKNHYPLNTKWTLLKNSEITFQEFLDAPIIYSDAFKHLSEQEFPKKMHNTVQKNEVVVFRHKLLDGKNAKNIRLMIDDGDTNKMVKPTMVEHKKNTFTFEYTFPEKGFYDVHVLIADDVVMTYTFDVKS